MSVFHRTYTETQDGGVDLMQPLMYLRHLFKDVSTFLQLWLWIYIRQQYSATEKHKSSVEVHTVVILAPQWLLASFFSRFQRLITFDAVFSKCWW